MRKCFVVIITVVFLITLIAPMAVASTQGNLLDNLSSTAIKAFNSLSGNGVNLQVNGKEINPDVPPYIDRNSRTMVPLRFAAESLGCNVGWDGSTQTVSVDRGNSHIALVIGNKEAAVNGSTLQMDTEAVIKEKRTMVPLRFVSEALGAKVEWVADTRTVVITDNGGTVNTGNSGNSNATPDNNDTSTGDSRWPDKVKKLIPGGGGTVTKPIDTTPPEPWGEY